MKKIFAIALALVMVLSMASAFALTDCSPVNFTWSCPVDVLECGKAVVEVVPYVHTNAACDGDEFVVSDCATAIKGENVYYAIKLTVDANSNPEWFAAATLTFDSTGLKDALEGETYAGWPASSDKEKVYYLANTNDEWVEAKYAEFNTADVDADDETIPVIFGAKVEKAATAEVCAKITSYSDGIAVWSYNGITVTVTGDEKAIDTLVFDDGDDEEVTVTVEEGKITAIDATSDKFFAEVVSTFKFNNCAIGTCVTPENIQDNFGWDDEQEDCFAWSAKGMAVVDTDCVVAIPKTGDVSVVAYAVMAVVAAAGMLKK